MSGDGCWPRQTGQMLLCVLSYALRWHFSMPDNAPEGLSPYLQQKDGKRLLSPSLANHWGDLHVLLDAVPGFPSGIVNPLPLLHGQRELLRSFCRGHICSPTVSLHAESALPTDFHYTSPSCCMVVPTTTLSRSQCPSVRAPGQRVHHQVAHPEFQDSWLHTPAGVPSGCHHCQSSVASLKIFITTRGPDIIILHLQMGKLRLRESDYLVHTGTQRICS